MPSLRIFMTFLWEVEPPSWWQIEVDASLATVLWISLTRDVSIYYCCEPYPCVNHDYPVFSLIE